MKHEASAQFESISQEAEGQFGEQVAQSRSRYHGGTDHRRTFGQISSGKEFLGNACLIVAESHSQSSQGNTKKHDPESRGPQRQLCRHTRFGRILGSVLPTFFEPEWLEALVFRIALDDEQGPWQNENRHENGIDQIGGLVSELGNDNGEQRRPENGGNARKARCNADHLAAMLLCKPVANEHRRCHGETRRYANTPKKARNVKHRQIGSERADQRAGNHGECTNRKCQIDADLLVLENVSPNGHGNDNGYCLSGKHEGKVSTRAPQSSRNGHHVHANDRVDQCHRSGKHEATTYQNEPCVVKAPHLRLFSHRNPFPNRLPLDKDPLTKESREALRLEPSGKTNSTAKTANPFHDPTRGALCPPFALIEQTPWGTRQSCEAAPLRKAYLGANST